MQTSSEHRPFSIKLWPPNKNTRFVLVEQMTTNLSAPTVFSQKYGSWSKEEAEEKANQIEEMAFTTADEFYRKEPDGDGSSAVQVYAKECSKYILKALTKGPVHKIKEV